MPPVYIFPHIPKCAGTTLCYHVENSCRPESVLNLYWRKKLLCAAGDWVGSTTREDLDQQLAVLNEARASQIKVIYGHMVYFGIHKFFTQEPRYIALLRHPVDRAISLYNSLVFQLERGRAIPNGLEEILVRDGKFVDFSEYFQRLPNKDDMLRHLMQKDFTDSEPVNETHLAQAKQFLEESYFVSTTEHFDRDVPSLYRELGIQKLFGSRNVTRRSYVDAKDPAIRQMIQDSCPLDRALYDHAVAINEDRCSGTRGLRM